MTRAEPRAPRSALPLAILVALASVGSCRCDEHPLYDASVNRFDTFYLGGGNSQTRPFRSVQYDPDAAFAVELRHRHEGPQVVIAARLFADAPADLEGEVLVHAPAGSLTDEPTEPPEPEPPEPEPLAAFEHVDDDLVLATIDRDTLAALARRGARLTIRLRDEVGATAHMDLTPADLLDPRPLADEEAIP